MHPRTYTVSLWVFFIFSFLLVWLFQSEAKAAGTPFQAQPVAYTVVFANFVLFGIPLLIRYLLCSLETTAVITSIAPRGPLFRRENKVFTTSYTGPDGKSYTAILEFTLQQARDFKVGDSIQIKVNPRNPKKYLILREPRRA